MSIFFGLQDFRTKEHKESIRQIYDGSLTAFHRIISQSDHNKEIKENNKKLKELGIKSEDLEVKHTDDFIDIMYIRSLLDQKHISKLSNTLFDRKWVIGINKTQIPFFTSDHPLVKHTYKNKGHFYREGYSSDERSESYETKLYQNDLRYCL